MAAVAFDSAGFYDAGVSVAIAVSWERLRFGRNRGTVAGGAASRSDRAFLSATAERLGMRGLLAIVSDSDLKRFGFLAADVETDRALKSGGWGQADFSFLSHDKKHHYTVLASDVFRGAAAPRTVDSVVMGRDAFFLADHQEMGCEVRSQFEQLAQLGSETGIGGQG